MMEKALLINSVVMFCALTLAAVFAAHCATIWIKDRREERSRAYKAELSRVLDRADADREQWIQLVTEKDSQISKLLDEVASLTMSLDRTKKLLEVSEGLRTKG